MKILLTILFLTYSFAAQSARTETIVSDIDFKADVLVKTITCRDGIPSEHFPIFTSVTIPSQRFTTNFKTDRLLLQNANELRMSFPPATKCEELLAPLQDKKYVRVEGNKKVTFLASIRNDRGLKNECQVTSHEELTIEILGAQARGLANMIILPADPKFCE